MQNLFEDIEPNKILAELRNACSSMRALINTQYAPSLIGYLWGLVFLSLMKKGEDGGENELRPVSGDEKEIIFAMEYIHAVLATDGVRVNQFQNVDEETADKLVQLAAKAIGLCFGYGFNQALADEEDQDKAFRDTEILNTWFLIRGKRYQVLEQDFFEFVLSPHDDVLKELYGVDGAFIATEIQKFTDRTRKGLAFGAETLHQLMADSKQAAENRGLSYEAFLENIGDESPDIAAEAQSAIMDMFFGGPFNLSKHTDLPEKLLSDLAHPVGTNKEFFAEGDFAGTPFRTLPARLLPLIEVAGDFYCTEPSFLRDGAYRAISRAVVRHKPDYRETWNQRQKTVSENAVPTLMNDHLVGARVYTDVFYPLSDKRRWAETDCIIVIDDVLMCIEVKAGGEALRAPAESLETHKTKIDQLIVAAYRQCDRFISYLGREASRPIYRKKEDGTFEEIETLELKNFRRVIPIGLTLEAFTPFSSGIKTRQDVTAIEGKYEFISMSIDDLMVFRKLLSSTGEFLHYLEVRQAVAAMKNVDLHDEMDHLAAYLSQNRFDLTVQKEFIEKEGAHMVTMSGYDADVIGPYFDDPDWPEVDRPKQIYPERLAELLSMLEETRKPGWLAGDSLLRDLGTEGRDSFVDLFERVLPILQMRSQTHFAMQAETSLVFVVSRSDGIDRRSSAVRTAELFALAMSQSSANLFEIGVLATGKISWARFSRIPSPSILRTDYGQLLHEAEAVKAKVQPTGSKKKRQSRRRR